MSMERLHNNNPTKCHLYKCAWWDCKMQKPHPGSLCKWEAWWKLSLQRYAYFLKLQNFLRINHCKILVFERRLHIVSENLARLTINYFRRFSVTTGWVYCWFSCRTLDCYISNNKDFCAKRSVIDRWSVVYICYPDSFAAKTLFHLKNLFIISVYWIIYNSLIFKFI